MMKISKELKNLLSHFNKNWKGSDQSRLFLDFDKTEILNIDQHPLKGELTNLINEQCGSLPYFKIKEEEILWCTMASSSNILQINVHLTKMGGICEDNLKKAINLLDHENQNDFRRFVNREVSFNPHNMFICKSKQKLKNYYEELFPWLEKCEKLFGFDSLIGYGKIRIYGFLAERFMSYWFKKNTNYKTMPIVFYDIGNDLV